jgi:hypothetical protein
MIKKIISKHYVILAFLLLSSISEAQNSCVYNGDTYAEGTAIGPYICMNGRWVLQ